MRKEIHFYCVYILARSVGLDPEKSKLIANCSQYVDDHIYDFPLRFENGAIFKQIPTAYKPTQVNKIVPQDVSIEPTLIFHFLPSGSVLIIETNSPIIQGICNYAIKEKDAYLLGIVLHVLADSYSHKYFKGVYDPYNKVRIVKGKKHVRSLLKYFLTFIPPIGHGMVDTVPDIPNIVWAFKRNNQVTPVSNFINTQLALKSILETLKSFCKLHYPELYSEKLNKSVLIKLYDLIRILPENSEKCCKMIQNAIQANYFSFPDYQAGDVRVTYDADKWFSETVRLTEPSGLKNVIKIYLKHKIFSYYPCKAHQDFYTSHYYRFNKAAQKYKMYVVNSYLHDILI